MNIIVRGWRILSVMLSVLLQVNVPDFLNRYLRSHHRRFIYKRSDLNISGLIAKNKK
jgi:hypothetical protein